FAAGSNPQVTLNDETFVVDPAEIHSISFDGVSGADTATLTDSTGDFDQLSLWDGGGTLTGSNYTLNLTATPNVDVSAANGAAYFYGSSSGSNTFTGTNIGASMTGSD